MTLSERESTEKWSEIDTVLKQLETIVEQLVKDAERVDKAEREEVAKLHAEVAHMMTRLEDSNYFVPPPGFNHLFLTVTVFPCSVVKLMTTLSTADYKENSIHAQLVSQATVSRLLTHFLSLSLFSGHFGKVSEQGKTRVKVWRQAANPFCKQRSRPKDH